MFITVMLGRKEESKWTISTLSCLAAWVSLVAHQIIVPIRPNECSL